MLVRKVTRAILATSALSFALVTQATQVAHAADAYAPPPASVDWSGVYVGAIAGYGWGDKDVYDTEEPDDQGSYNVDGFLGGLEAGANWQSDRLVLGVEGDFSFTGMEGDGLIDGDDPMATDIDYLATLTGRLGFAANQALFYVEGGGAWVGEDHAFGSIANGDYDTASGNRWGWVVGAGVEYALNDKWSAKIEYNYMDFGSHNVRFSDAGEDVTVDQQIQTVKLGVNFRF